MHYSTLGYNPNPLISLYQTDFIQKLRQLWVSSVDTILPEDEFLLFPDIHGLLLAALRPNNASRGEYIDILRGQYIKYKNGEKLINDSDKIPGTNIALTLDFFNPDIEIPNHPDHKKNNIQVTFGSKTPKEWKELFAQSFDIVRKVSPGFMGEIELIIRKIIPFDVSHSVHNSGSYSDFIGHLVMSYPTGMDHGELALLEAILHEYNHNKLNLVLQTKTLILNDRREMYYSPYRPDARHIHGIYLGVHAILGAFWVIWNAHVSGIIQLPINWQEKAALYVFKNGLSFQVLDKYGIFTPEGKGILEEMKRVHTECLSFIREAGLSQEVIMRARTSLREHYLNVQKQYPYLKS